MRWTTIAALIVGGVGLLFLAVGGGLRFLVDTSATVDAETQLPVATAASLPSVAAGTRVLVEATIARDAPAVFQDFVAARRWKSEGTVTPAKTPGSSQQPTERWRLLEALTPPLPVEAGGRLTLTGYTLRAECHQWIQNELFVARPERAEGFRAGDAVVAVGRATPQGLAEAALSCGDREQYLAGVRSNAGVPALLGLIFLLVGGLLSAVAVLVVWLGRPKPA